MNFCIWFSALYTYVWRDVNSNALFGARRWLFVPCWPFSPHATAPVYFYFKIDLLAGSRSRRARWQMFYCSITPSRVEYNLLFLHKTFFYIFYAFVVTLSHLIFERRASSTCSEALPLIWRLSLRLRVCGAIWCLGWSHYGLGKLSCCVYWACFLKIQNVLVRLQPLKMFYFVRNFWI